MATIKQKSMPNNYELVWDCTAGVGQTSNKKRPMVQMPRPTKNEGRATRAGTTLPLPQQLADILLI